MKQAFTDMIEFHRAGKQVIGEYAHVPLHSLTENDLGVPHVARLFRHLGQIAVMTDDEKLVMLRVRLIVEELGELLSAIAQPDAVEVADALADLVYVVVGTAVAFGVDLPEVWDEVHTSNMRKFGSGSWTDEHGKIRKPSDWTPPDIEGVLDEQEGPLGEVY